MRFANIGLAPICHLTSNFPSQPSGSCRGTGLWPAADSIVDLFQESSAIVNHSATQDNTNTRRAGIHLSDHLSLLIGGAANHEDDNILGLVASVPAAFQEWVLHLLQAALNQILESHLQSWRVLSVDIFNTLQTLEAVSSTREE